VIRTALVALLLGGCLEFPAEKPCRTDDDCHSDHVCHDGACEARGPRDERDAAVADALPPADAAPDAGPCGPLDRGHAADCAACLERSGGICGALRTCGADDVCAPAWACAEGCGDPRCVADCKAPSGADIPWITLQTLVFRGCSAACDLGREWSCTGAFDWGAVVHQTLHIRLAVLQVPDNTPYPGAHVRACRELDPTCTPPLAETTSDGDGLAALDIDTGFDTLGFNGHFVIDGGPLLPTVSVPAAPLVQDGAYLQPVITTGAADTVIGLVTGQVRAPGTAIVLAQVRDCRGFPAPDLVVDVAGAPGQHAFYFNGNAPDPARDATDPSGLVGFVNVPVSGGGSSLTLAAHRKGEAVILARRQALVRPDQLTFLLMGPAARD
jgi:hypothetical protein